MANEVEILVKSKDQTNFDTPRKNVKEFGREAENTGRKLHTFGTVGFNAAGKLRAGLGFASAGVAGLAIGVGALAAKTAPKIVGLAVSVEAMGNKTKVVFGNSIGVVDKWAGTVSNRFGMTKTETESLAASIGDLLTPMGFTQKAAADMSTKVGTLAGALSEWSNGQLSVKDTTGILQDALTGEFDSLKQLGVQIDADTIKTILHKEGKDKLTGAAKKQAEAEAIVAEITRQSSNALTGYKENTNKLGNSVKEAQAKLKTFREELIKKVTPWLTSAFTWFNDHWIDIESGLLDLADAANTLVGPLAAVAVASIRVAQGLALVAFQQALVRGNVKDAVKYQLLADKLGRVAEQASELGGTLKDKTNKELATLRTRMEAIKSKRVDVQLRSDAIATARRINASLARIPGRKNITVVATERGITTIRRLIDSIHGKTVTVGIVTGRIGGVGTFAQASGGIVGAASGGIRNRLTMVGEHGPELLDLAPGSRVHSNPDTERIMSSAGGGRTVVEINLRGDKTLIEWLQKQIRVRGGNVQTVLGS